MTSNFTNQAMDFLNWRGSILGKNKELEREIVCKCFGCVFTAIDPFRGDLGSIIDLRKTPINIIKHIKEIAQYFIFI